MSIGKVLLMGTNSFRKESVAACNEIARAMLASDKVLMAGTTPLVDTTILRAEKWSWDLRIWIVLKTFLRL